jgi:energy-coupling factor transporter transmembrane protein EcfT
MLTHHFVDYRPVAYHKRIGKSKVHYFRDTLRAAQIMVFTVLLFNPIKMYLVLIGAALAVVAPAIVAALAVPAWQVPLLVGVLLALTCLLLFAVGLLAEQNTRMAALQGRIKARRDPLE